MSDDGVMNTHDLFVPFTVVESQGGPFDDASFTAGVQIGVLYTTLGDPTTESPYRTTIYVALCHQADLLAMGNGWESKVVGVNDVWAMIEFHRRPTEHLTLTPEPPRA